MEQKILITECSVQNQVYLAACLYQGTILTEIRMEEREQSSILGNVYVGRVQKIVKNLGAAFIDIAPGKSCYYPLKDLQNPCFVKKINASGLVQGDELLVQVSREELKTKAPSVTTNITLNGRYFVVTSEKKSIGISGKLKKEQREFYKQFIAEHLKKDVGVIVRTNAANANEQELLQELDQLSGQLADMLEHAPMRTCYSCLYRSEAKYRQFIRNAYSQLLTEIVTDDASIYRDVLQYCAEYETLQKIPVRLYQDSLLPLKKLYNLDRQIEHALSERVWLNCGGYLVIQPTEALTVVDVNTGRSAVKKDREQHFLKVNLEAAKEIARQIRLRNLSGIIVVDFIDLCEREDEQTLMDYLKACVRTDPVPVQVVDMTRLHLVEMTRRKVEKSLIEQIRRSPETREKEL